MWFYLSNINCRFYREKRIEPFWVVFMCTRTQVNVGPKQTFPEKPMLMLCTVLCFCVSLFSILPNEKKNTQFPFETRCSIPLWAQFNFYHPHITFAVAQKLFSCDWYYYYSALTVAKLTAAVPKCISENKQNSFRIEKRKNGVKMKIRIMNDKINNILLSVSLSVADSLQKRTMNKHEMSNLRCCLLSVMYRNVFSCFVVCFSMEKLHLKNNQPKTLRRTNRTKPNRKWKKTHLRIFHIDNFQINIMKLSFDYEEKKAKKKRVNAFVHKFWFIAIYWKFC